MGAGTGDIRWPMLSVLARWMSLGAGRCVTNGTPARAASNRWILGMRWVARLGTECVRHVGVMSVCGGGGAGRCALSFNHIAPTGACFAYRIRSGRGSRAYAMSPSQMVAVYDVVEIAGISCGMISKTLAYDLNRNHTM